MYILTPHILLHAALQADTSFWAAYPTQGVIWLNEAIHNLCTILKLVAALATKVEVRALFFNAQEAKVMQLFWKSWDTSNPQLEYTLTIPPLLVFSTVPLHISTHARWKEILVATGW